MGMPNKTQQILHDLPKAYTGLLYGYYVQKMNIIPQIIFQILNAAIWFVDSILAYNLRSRFFPGMQFSQNHLDNSRASFKIQKVMLPSLKCKIFPFSSIFVSFTQLSRQ